MLLLASILSSNLFTDTTSFLLYAVIFLASVTLFLVRTILKPEQDWYRCRALAESVKTSILAIHDACVSFLETSLMLEIQETNSRIA